jgi:hypothetical protein
MKRSIEPPRVTKGAGSYSDGHPLDDVQYLECKIILKPERFDCRDSLFEFGSLLAGPAERHGVGLSTRGFGREPLKIREVCFFDTKDFRLYNNAFILRRRVPYVDGFAAGDPEIVFKFRHPDIQKAATVDVRPRVAGDYRVKFKCEALPLKDAVGGVRMLFSHNVEFGFSQVRSADPTSVETIVRVLPALGSLKRSPGERVELVSQTIVEEVLQDIAVLDFGKGLQSVANVALWRARGDHRPLVGEFAFQLRFKRRDELHRKAMKRCERFFVAVQRAARSRIALGATKTGVVYRLQGNPPRAHE